jgi:hypothetical protein
MPYTLAQAAAAVGRNRSTLLRGIKSGRISAARDELTGAWLIDPAELHRIYANADAQGTEPVNGEARISTQPADLRLQLEVERTRTAGLEARVNDLQVTLEDLRHRLDKEAEERRQAQDRLTEVQSKLTAILTDQRSTPPAAPFTPQPAPPVPAKRRWWLWRS